MAPIAFVTTTGCATSGVMIPFVTTTGCVPGLLIGPGKIIGVGDFSGNCTVGAVVVFSGNATVGVDGIGMSGSDTVPIVTSVDLAPDSGIGAVSGCGNSGATFTSGASDLSTWGSTIGTVGGAFASGCPSTDCPHNSPANPVP